MMSEHYLIFSDMDGTLLNHHDYRYDAVLPMLSRLDELNIPVILNTSKTKAEITSWVERLDIAHPFIVENGSAVYIPIGYFKDPNILENELTVDGDYEVFITGVDIAILKDFISATKPDAIDFTACSLAEAMAITGLPEADCIDARTRQYSIPLVFNDEDAEFEFSIEAKKAGFSTLRGGRFLHLMGQTNKGSCMRVLQQQYEKAYGSTFLCIALGDSPNDTAMLDEADIAVIVPSPSSHKLRLTRDDVLTSRKSAPEGWVEGITNVLPDLIKTTRG